MPGSIAACAVSCRLHQLNFAEILIPADEAETEAFPVSEGPSAHGFRPFSGYQHDFAERAGFHYQMVCFRRLRQGQLDAHHGP